jgi:hypothetical protein
MFPPLPAERKVSWRTINISQPITLIFSSLRRPQAALVYKPPSKKHHTWALRDADRMHKVIAAHQRMITLSEDPDQQAILFERLCKLTALEN